MSPIWLRKGQAQVAVTVEGWLNPFCDHSTHLTLSQMGITTHSDVEWAELLIPPHWADLGAAIWVVEWYPLQSVQFRPENWRWNKDLCVLVFFFLLPLSLCFSVYLCLSLSHSMFLSGSLCFSLFLSVSLFVSVSVSLSIILARLQVPKSSCQKADCTTKRRSLKCHLSIVSGRFIIPQFIYFSSGNSGFLEVPSPITTSARFGLLCIYQQPFYVLFSYVWSLFGRDNTQQKHKSQSTEKTCVRPDLANS